jgi:hypothetical protein
MNETEQTMSNSESHSGSNKSHSGSNDSTPSGGEPGADPGATTGAPARWRGPDLITLAAGLGALAVAGSTLLGRVGWLPGMDLRWVVAAAAILIGLLLVIGGVHPRRS